MKTFISAGRKEFLLLAFAGNLWCAGVQAQNSAPAGTRLVEEKTTVETTRVYESRPTPPQYIPRKTAIFIDNRAGPQLNDKVLFFEDQVASRASGKDFTILSRGDVLKALNTYRGADVSATTRSTEVKIDASASRTDVRSEIISPGDRNTIGTKLDQSLSDNSSALRLAQNMGADFILFATIGSFAKETKSFDDPSIGVKVKNTVYNLRGTFKVTEGVTGGSLGGDAFRSAKTIRQSENLQTENDDVINELLEDAAGKIVGGLAARAAQFVPAATPSQVEISIACAVKDLAGNEITLPDIHVNENNMVVKGPRELAVQASATIEIDGLAVGTTPTKLFVAPGIHKLRLTRPGFTDAELHINALDGLNLTPTLQLSDDGFRRWKEIRTFLDGLDVSRKLTDARAEEIRGNAQRLRQSGFLVDYRINSKTAPTIVRKSSIYSADPY